MSPSAERAFLQWWSEKPQAHTAGPPSLPTARHNTNELTSRQPSVRPIPNWKTQSTRPGSSVSRLYCRTALDPVVTIHAQLEGDVFRDLEVWYHHRQTEVGRRRVRSTAPNQLERRISTLMTRSLRAVDSQAFEPRVLCWPIPLEKFACVCSSWKNAWGSILLHEINTKLSTR